VTAGCDAPEVPPVYDAQHSVLFVVCVSGNDRGRKSDSLSANSGLEKRASFHGFQGSHGSCAVCGNIVSGLIR